MPWSPRHFVRKLSFSDVEVLWTNQIEQFEQVQASNKIKRDELNSLKIRVQTTIDDKLANNREKLIILIKAKEEEIQQFQMLNYKNLLQTILATETTTETDYFKLLDLNLRRAEELPYSYKKRLDQVEKSQESSEVMIKEFGSVPK
jgi:hypothetical protein